MKPRTQPRRMSPKKLAANGGKIPFSSISPSGKGVKRVNTKAKAKRTARYRKMLSGKEYKAARAEAWERAGGQCEFVQHVEGRRCLYDRESGEIIQDADRYVATEPFEYSARCPNTLCLQAHHLRYPKTRPLSASDLQILCVRHHELAESQKPHKTRMF